MPLSDEKYLLLTTFRRSGDPVATPVWIVGLDSGEMGFWTSSASGKVKRLRHTPRVTLQPCDARGRPTPGSAVSDGTARLVEGPELEAISERVRDKYGFMTKLTPILGLVGGLAKGKRMPYGDNGVVIAVAHEASPA